MYETDIAKHETFMDSRKKYRFHEFPRKVVVSIEEETKRFLLETGIVLNSSEHHEIVRQIFEIIDNDHPSYNDSLLKLPLFRHLNQTQEAVNKYVGLNGNLNSLAYNLKKSVYILGISIYLKCVKIGLYEDGKTPYILETLQGDLLILYNYLYDRR